MGEGWVQNERMKVKKWEKDMRRTGNGCVKDDRKMDKRREKDG